MVNDVCDECSKDEVVVDAEGVLDYRKLCYDCALEAKEYMERALDDRKDFLESTEKDLEEFVKKVNEKGYDYGKDMNRYAVSGRERVDMLEKQAHSIREDIETIKNKIDEIEKLSN